MQKFIFSCTVKNNFIGYTYMSLANFVKNSYATKEYIKPLNYFIAFRGFIATDWTLETDKIFSAISFLCWSVGSKSADSLTATKI